MKNQRTAIHITPEASDTHIEGCEFEGFDVAIKDEGKRTKIFNSVFRGIKKIWHEYFWVRLVLEIVFTLVVAYLVYKFGWNK